MDSGIQLTVLLLQDHIVLHCSHLDEPGLSRIVDERGITSPAVRILMLKLRRVEKLAPCASRSFSTPPGLLFHENAGIRRLLGQFTLSVYKLHERQVIFSADIRIVSPNAGAM